MNLLPRATHPWSQRLARRHAPRQAAGQRGWRSYGRCLRWEFGFSCAFCLTHEADVSGVLGSEYMQTEHFILKSQHPGGKNLYANCFYSCTSCNRKRHKKPNVDFHGRRLLNPCDDVWQLFFTSIEDELRPLCHDALYTAWAYDLNHPCKVKLRENRREAIAESFAVYEAMQGGILDRLLERFGDTHDPELVIACRALTQRSREAVRELKRWDAVPENADTECRCEDSPAHCLLPAVLEEQTIHLELSPSGVAG
jgi:hypothetical protein